MLFFCSGATFIRWALQTSVGGTGCEIPWVLKTQPSVCKAAGACSQPGKGLANGQHVEHLGFIAFHDTWDG